MNHLGLFLIRIFSEGVYDLAVVPFSVLHLLGRAHHRYVQLTAARADVVPVYEIDVREFPPIEDTVLDGHGFASSEEGATEVSVCVHAGKVARLVDVASELSM